MVTAISYDNTVAGISAVNQEFEFSAKCINYKNLSCCKEIVLHCILFRNVADCANNDKKMPSWRSKMCILSCTLPIAHFSYFDHYLEQTCKVTRTIKCYLVESFIVAAYAMKILRCTGHLKTSPGSLQKQK